MRIYERKPVEFRQLCMIVKTVLLREPTIENSEWKARISETLAKQGWAEPEDLEMVSRAMAAVEHALSKTSDARPAVRVPQRPIHEPEPVLYQPRTHNPAGYDFVMNLELPASRASVQSRRDVFRRPVEDAARVEGMRSLHAEILAAPRGSEERAMLEQKLADVMRWTALSSRAARIRKEAS